MNKTVPVWAFGVLSVVGAILVGSMAVSWVDFGGGISGIRLAWESNHWMFLVPIAGGALLATAATRSPATRLAAIFAGTVITGYVLFDVATSMVHGGLDTWLILGGAGVMLASTSKDRTPWRALGGLAVLVGFFAPWADLSMWKLLRLADGHMPVLWLVPVAGLGGIISAGNQVTGAKLAAACGVAVYGALLWAIGSVAYQIFDLGAWGALGASSVALAIGVLARAPAPEVASTSTSAA